MSVKDPLLTRQVLLRTVSSEIRCTRWGGWDDDYDDEGDYTWGETTDRDLSLKLSTWGNVKISEDEEMEPDDFFEGKEP